MSMTVGQIARVGAAIGIERRKRSWEINFGDLQSVLRNQNVTL